MSSASTIVPRRLHASLNGHKGPIHIATYAKGSAQYILTGGQDRTIKLWNKESGSIVKTYSGHGYEVLSISVSPENAKFASSGGDRVAYVWDVASGETLRRYSGHLGRINAIQFNPDASVVASGSFDGTVKLWDIRSQSRNAIQTLDDARDSISSIQITSSEIITGSVDGYVRSYDLRKGKLTSDYLGHPVTHILPTKDSLSLLITTLNSTLRLFDRANGTLLNSYRGHKNESYRTSACFGYGEATVLCGDEDGRIWGWNLLEGDIIGINPPPKAHEKVITWLEHHPISEAEMVSASADGTAKIWRA
ncbi:hypothetical protein FRC02_010512 [Tulasnella sp. 418]|nr:hypothetical protein FRC02_010512 [Tulasnella sp. 418]